MLRYAPFENWLDNIWYQPPATIPNRHRIIEPMERFTSPLQGKFTVKNDPKKSLPVFQFESCLLYRFVNRTTSVFVGLTPRLTVSLSIYIFFNTVTMYHLVTFLNGSLSWPITLSDTILHRWKIKYFRKVETKRISQVVYGFYGENNAYAESSMPYDLLNFIQLSMGFGVADYKTEISFQKFKIVDPIWRMEFLKFDALPSVFKNSKWGIHLKTDSSFVNSDTKYLWVEIANAFKKKIFPIFTLKSELSAKPPTFYRWQPRYTIKSCTQITAHTHTQSPHSIFCTCIGEAINMQSIYSPIVMPCCVYLLVVACCCCIVLLCYCLIALLCFLNQPNHRPAALLQWLFDASSSSTILLLLSCLPATFFRCTFYGYIKYVCRFVWL